MKAPAVRTAALTAARIIHERCAIPGAAQAPIANRTNLVERTAALIDARFQASADR